MKKLLIINLIFAVTIFLFSSCATQNVFNYEKGLTHDSLLLSKAAYRIRIDDKVSLSVWDHDDLSIGSLYGIYNSNEVYGKWVLVDRAGEITLPRIGRVTVAGKTIRETEDTLTKLFSKSIVNPILKLQVLNREISILGEVKNPGNLLLEKESNPIMETIAKAGDFDFYADKRAVRLIRQTPEGPVMFQLDFTTMPDLFKSQIMLQPGDVIYVPTKKGKMLDKKAPTLIPFTSVVTTLAILATLIF